MNIIIIIIIITYYSENKEDLILHTNTCSNWIVSSSLNLYKKTDQVCLKCVIDLCPATHSITPLFYTYTFSCTAMARILATDSVVKKNISPPSLSLTLCLSPTPIYIKNSWLSNCMGQNVSWEADRFSDKRWHGTWKFITGFTTYRWLSVP